MRARGAFVQARVCGRMKLKRSAAGTAALVACLSCGVIGTPRPTPPSGEPSSLRSGTETLYFKATIPWTHGDAPASARTFTIYADADAVGAFCGLPQEVVRVTETPTEIRIQVLGYAPKPKTDGCADVGHRPQRHEITLDEPVGDRLLVDPQEAPSPG